MRKVKERKPAKKIRKPLTEKQKEQYAENKLWRCVDVIRKALVDYIPSVDWEQGGPLPVDIAVDKKIDIVWHIERDGHIRAAFQQKLINLKKDQRLSAAYMNNAVRLAVRELQHIRKEIVKEERRQEAVAAIVRLRKAS